MKSEKEIKQLAEEFTNGHYHYRGKDSFIHGYIRCQEDMSSKEIQPEEIWNKESQDKIKEYILNHVNNQSSEDILETELAAKKYAEEDMLGKKYTEEDIRKAIQVGISAEAGDYPDGWSFKLGISLEDYFINSLNKQD